MEFLVEFKLLKQKTKSDTQCVFSVRTDRRRGHAVSVHNTKAYGGSVGMVPLTLNLGTG